MGHFSSSLSQCKHDISPCLHPQRTLMGWGFRLSRCQMYHGSDSFIVARVLRAEKETSQKKTLAIALYKVFSLQFPVGIPFNSLQTCPQSDLWHHLQGGFFFFWLAMHVFCSGHPEGNEESSWRESRGGNQHGGLNEKAGCPMRC